MAIFHFDLAAISRAGGDSGVRAAAYATGTRRVDARTGCVFDFSPKAPEILATGRIGPVNWQAAEAAERRRDAKVARTLLLALPHEASLGRQIDLLLKFARWLRYKHGVAIEWAIHAAPGDPRNRHAHLVLTTRRVGDDGVHGSKTRELDVVRTSRSIVTRWRGHWQLLVNGTLAAVRSTATVDGRSLAARGVARPARMHAGQTQTAQHRAGYDTPAARHNAAVDQIEKLNAELARLNGRLRHFRNMRRRERVKRQMRIARQRGRRQVGVHGITPAISDQREQPIPTPTTVQQSSAEAHRKPPRRR